MKIRVLSSGSKGNVTLVELKNKNILIDAGLPLKNILKRTDNIFPNIDILIITHTHQDHIKGLTSYIKKYNPLVLTTSKQLQSIIPNANINITKEYTDIDVKIELFALSHDVPCCGIIITSDNKQLVYITDTGYLKEQTLEKIKDKDVYIIESNHNIERLMNCSYPFPIKQRILGDTGHLSNERTKEYLEKIITSKTKTVILAHLSEENNSEQLVQEAMKDILTKHKNINLKIAKQDTPLEEIEV